MDIAKEFTSFQLRTGITWKSTSLSVNVGNDCYAEIDGATDWIPLTTVRMEPEETLLAGELPQRIHVQTLTLTCSFTTISLPNDASQGPETVTIGIDLSIDGEPHGSRLISPMTLEGRPTIQHEYFWDMQQTPPIEKRALISVRFTFYRPPAFSSERVFEVKHPLLDVNTVTKMHASPNESVKTDLGRLYNLLRKDDKPLSFQCKEQHGQSSDLDSTIVYQNIEGIFIPILQVPILPDNQTGAAYTCSFIVEYAPDVLGYIFDTSIYPLEVTIQTIHQDPLSQDTAHVFTYPLSKPRVVPDYDIASPTGIYVWHAPHHLQHYDLGYEFGIATTDRHYLSPTPRSLPSEMIIQMHNNVAFPDFVHSWSPVLACRTHSEEQYPVEMAIPEDGILDLSDGMFHGFGMTCRVRPTTMPTSALFPYHFEYQFYRQVPSIQTTQLLPHTVFDSTTESMTTVNPVYIYDITKTVDDTALPTVIPIPFKNVITLSPLRTYTEGRMTLQYLPDYPPLSLIDLVLVMVSDVDTPLPQSAHGSGINVDLIIRSGRHIILEKRVRGTVLGHNFDAFVSNPDRIDTILQPQRPIRSQRVSIQLPLRHINKTQPLDITVQLHMHTEFDPSTVTFYPIVVMDHVNAPDKYMPGYAHITPYLSSPPRAYSYRCVEWSEMAASYMYGTRSQAPLTNDNSVRCAHVLNDNGQVDVSDTTRWKRTEHRLSIHRSPQCFYELAAVCVTPSTTMEGAYDIHPLADCPSFLNDIHAVPCTMVERTSPRWDYTLTRGSRQEFIFSDPSKPLFKSSWEYHGDPRLTLTIAMRGITSNGDKDPNSHGPDWVVVSRDVPAYLAYGNDLPRLPFIPFDRKIRDVQVKYTLNGHPSVTFTDSVRYDPPSRTPLDCLSTEFKIIDPITHLCVCKDGYESDLNNGKDNPFIFPHEFTCIYRCGLQTWDSEKEICVNQDGEPICRAEGIWRSDRQTCTCFDGLSGEYCQSNSCDQLQCIFDHTIASAVNTSDYGDECVTVTNPSVVTSTLQCNCLPQYTGDRCQYEWLCPDECVNGTLTFMPSSEQPNRCTCVCDNDHISGPACDQCGIRCEHGGTPNAKCTACDCLDGYSRETCGTLVWYHQFRLLPLPLDIAKDIAAGDFRGLRHMLVRSLMADYFELLQNVFTVMDTNTDNSIRLVNDFVEFTVYVPDDPIHLPSITIRFMLYSENMSPEMIAYAQTHGLVFDWGRTDHISTAFESFSTVVSLYLPDASIDIVFQDPGCTTRQCKETTPPDGDDGNDHDSNAAFDMDGINILHLVVLVSSAAWGITSFLF